MECATFMNSIIINKNAMNKTSKFLKLIMILIASVAITSCVQDDDYTVPNSLGEEENNSLQTLLTNATEVSIAEVKAMYQSGSVLEPVDTDIYVKGFVSSSDHTGNFFKEFFIQDKPENPTIGLKIFLNQVDSYNQFNQGREVFINLKGLYIGEERVGNGVVAIGGDIQTDQYGTKILRLHEGQVRQKVLRSSVTEEMVPLTVTFADLSNSHVGLLISVENAQFADNLAGKRYFDPSQLYDTQRIIQTCVGFDYSSFKIETSSFSSFKNELLPEGNGTITAIVNKTFDGASMVLGLNSTDDVHFTGERCSLVDASDFTTIFEEDFETAGEHVDLNFPGWTNFAQAGNRVWRERNYQGEGYASFGAFGSGQASNIGWLVTPGIDMDAQDNEFLKFQSAQHHMDSSAINTLEVLISTDYNGSDVLGATWVAVPATTATEANDWYEWVDSGLIDLSSYTGTIHVAFKVIGSDTVPLMGGTYQIDNVSVISAN